MPQVSYRSSNNHGYATAVGSGHHDRVSQPQDAVGGSGAAEGKRANFGPPGERHPKFVYSGNPVIGVGQAHLPAMPDARQGLAAWWERLLARVIDAAILAAVLAPTWIAAWRHFVTTIRSITNSYPPGAQLAAIPAANAAVMHAERHLFSQLSLVLSLFLVLAFGYDWVQHALWGQTIGKRALGIQVVREQSYTKVSPGAAGGRAAVYALTPLVPVLGWIFALFNELWLAWDPRGQCLHDKAANTVVVKKTYLRSQPVSDGWTAYPSM